MLQQGSGTPGMHPEYNRGPTGVAAGLPIYKATPGARKTALDIKANTPPSDARTAMGQGFMGEVSGMGVNLKARDPPKEVPSPTPPDSARHVECNRKLSKCNADLAAKNADMEKKLRELTEKSNAAIAAAQASAAKFENLYKGKKTKEEKDALASAKDNLKRCSAEKASLESDLEDARAAARKMGAELDDMRAEARKHAASDRMYIDALQKAEAKYDKDRKDCDDRVAASAAAMASLERDIASVRDKLRGMASDLDSARGDKDACDKLTARLSERIAKLEGALADAVREAAQKQSERLDDADKTAAKHAEALRSAESRAAAAEADAAAARRDLQLAEIKVATIQTEVARYRSDKDSCDKLVDDLKSKLDGLRAHLEKATKDSADSQNDCDSQIADLRDSLERAQKEATEYRLSATLMSEEVARLRDDQLDKKSELQERIETLELELEAARSKAALDADDLKVQVTTCGAELADLKATKEEVMRQMDDRIAEMSRMEAESARSLSDVATYRSTVATLEEKIAACSDKYERAAADLSSAAAKLADCTSAETAFRSRIASLERQVADSTSADTERHGQYELELNELREGLADCHEAGRRTAKLSDDFIRACYAAFDLYGSIGSVRNAVIQASTTGDADAFALAKARYHDKLDQLRNAVNFSARPFKELATVLREKFKINTVIDWFHVSDREKDVEMSNLLTKAGRQAKGARLEQPRWNGAAARGGAGIDGIPVLPWALALLTVAMAAVPR